MLLYMQWNTRTKRKAHLAFACCHGCEKEIAIGRNSALGGPELHIGYLFRQDQDNHHLRQYRAARSNQEDRKPPGLTELTPTT
jgi:hypothetical protein